MVYALWKWISLNLIEIGRTGCFFARFYYYSNQRICKHDVPIRKTHFLSSTVHIQAASVFRTSRKSLTCNGPSRTKQTTAAHRNINNVSGTARSWNDHSDAEGRRQHLLPEIPDVAFDSLSRNSHCLDRYCNGYGCFESMLGVGKRADR